MYIEKEMYISHAHTRLDMLFSCMCVICVSYVMLAALEELSGLVVSTCGLLPPCGLLSTTSVPFPLSSYLSGELQDVRHTAYMGPTKICDGQDIQTW